jgi:hypothetical protein
MAQLHGKQIKNSSININDKLNINTDLNFSGQSITNLRPATGVTEAVIYSQITGFTDYYTTGATLVGSTAYFNRNDTLSAYTLDLSTLSPTGTTGGGYTSYTLTGGTYYEFSGQVNTLIVDKLVGSNTLVNLPISPLTDKIYIVTDRGGNSWRFPIRISGNTKNINGHADIVLKLKNNPSLTFLYNGTEYIII